MEQVNLDTPRRSRPYIFYDVVRSVCSTCLIRCEGKLIIQDGKVYLDKWCRPCGRERVLVAEDADYWRWARERFMKPAEMPLRFQTPMKWGCPYDCGLCPDHQQHACLVLIEVGDHCNLHCPICFAESGPHRPTWRSMEEIERMLDAVVSAEGRPDVVQLSGGEPTLHPQFWEILDAAKQRPIRHLMINTNGVRIAKEPEFARRLADYRKGTEVYLQFDSLRDEALLRLRGARLRSVREQALENLEANNISTTLVVTVMQGVNDHELGEIIEYALKWRCIRGITLQPVQQAGRHEGYTASENRLTLTGVRKRVLEQSSRFSSDDILPVPCHPDALAMAYGLKLNGKFFPLTGLMDPQVLLNGPDNTIVLEKIPAVREEIAKLFSTGIGPELQAKQLNELLCCLPQIEANGLGYENVFRLLIVRFADASDFDLRSVKRCCIHFAQPDGTIIPFDTYNLFYRDGRREKLEQLRRQVEQHHDL